MKKTMKNLASLGVLGIIAGTMLPGNAQSGEPVRVQATDELVASVAPSGTVTVRRKSDDRPVASIVPGLFEQGWQYRSIGRGTGFEAASEATIVNGKITASNAGAEVVVRTTLTADGNRLLVRCEMTPDRGVPLNSAHVSVNVATAAYLGATWIADTSKGAVPATAKDVHLVTAQNGAFTLGDGAKQVSVAATGTPVLLQDNRVFGGNDLEIRVGRQGERVLGEKTTEAIAFTVTLPGKVTLMKEESITLKAGTDWVPLDLKLDIVPGSALDFSRQFSEKAQQRAVRQERPVVAGSDGFVVLRNGHFAFEKTGKPVRFYGANLCFSANYLNHDEADRLADRFARIGYNTVRLHHYESDLIQHAHDGRGDAPDSLTFRPEQLDKLDYLVAAMKQRGIYIKTDLYVSRPVKGAEIGLPEGMDEFKAAVLVSQKARENWKEFSRRLLNHVNPYTKLAYKDDPAIAFLSVVNEPNATNYFGRLQGPLKTAFEAEWRNWRKSRNKPDAPMPSAVNDTPEGREAGAFLADLHTRAYRDMRDFLRNEIKTKALLTDLNGWSEAPAFMAARQELDWVDNHFYWDHPRFLERDWNLPSSGYQEGRSAVADGGAGPNFFAMTRLLDRPFSISEFNYAVPNPNRAEGGLLMGAASALQDWDAVWRFAYSHSRDAILNPSPLNYFDMACDPAGQAGDRMAVLLFRRGDLKPAKTTVARVLNPEALTNPTGDRVSVASFADLTLVTRVGTRLTSAKSPGEIALTEGDSATALEQLKKSGKLGLSNRTDLTRNVRESETGEVLIVGEEGQMRIETARTVGGIVPVNATLTVGPLSVTPDGARATVGLSSLDGKPVVESQRLLLIHLTDVQNSEMRYAAPDRKVLEAWGNLPHLVRRGSVRLALKRKGNGKLSVWRLDTAGNRVAPVMVQQSGDRVEWNVENVAPDGKATLYYELTTH